MMKKFLTFIVMMVVLTISTNAQNPKAYVGNKFLDNWSVGIQGGIQTNLYSWNTPQGAIAGFNLDKQITPMFGLTAEVGTGINNRRNWYTWYPHVHNGTMFDQLYVFMDGRYNLMNAIAGYKNKPRPFEIETVVGVGYGHGYANHDFYGVYKTDAMLAKAGLNFNYNVDKVGTWTVSLRPAVVWNLTPTGKFNNNHAVGQVTLGVTYHFKNSNGSRYLTEVNPVIIKRDVIKKVPVKVEVIKEVEKVVTVEPELKTVIIPFSFGEAQLSNNAKTKLDKIPTDKTVVINGYASYDGKLSKGKKQEAFNTKLSTARAEVVKTYLEERGVKVKEAVGKGLGTDDIGRVVIVDIQ